MDFLFLCSCSHGQAVVDHIPTGTPWESNNMQTPVQIRSVWTGFSVINKCWVYSSLLMSLSRISLITSPGPGGNIYIRKSENSYNPATCFSKEQVAKLLLAYLSPALDLLSQGFPGISTKWLPTGDTATAANLKKTPATFETQSTLLFHLLPGSFSYQKRKCYPAFSTQWSRKTLRRDWKKVSFKHK